ncbi:MAG: hypothetical protein QM742_07360 [Aquabacterium sp.]
MNASPRPSSSHWAPALLSLLAAGLAACSQIPATPRYQGDVLTTESANVATCHYLGELSSTSGLTGLFAPKGVDDIKQQLLRQAEGMGATHVVWDRPAAQYDSTSLSGKAYRCPR